MAAPPPDGCLRKTLSAHMASPTHSSHTPDTQFRAQNIFPPPCWRGTPGLLAHLPAAGWRWGPTASEVLGGLSVSERNIWNAQILIFIGTITSNMVFWRQTHSQWQEKWLARSFPLCTATSLRPSLASSTPSGCSPPPPAVCPALHTRPARGTSGCHTGSSTHSRCWWRHCSGRATLPRSLPTLPGRSDPSPGCSVAPR